MEDRNKKYRSILDNIEEGYYELDLAGNYTFCNKTVCTFMGLSDDELVGRKALDFLSP
ncbi:PAS domain S-box protein [Thermodesulfobacteriota bacterium]